MIRDVEQFPYEKGLNRLGLFNLDKRCLRGNMQEVYKLLNVAEKVIGIYYLLPFTTLEPREIK